MKTKLLVWVAFIVAITFNSCNQEEVFDFQEELPPGTEEVEETIFADAEKAFRLSMEMSTMALPANVNQIEISPSGAISANGETRLAIATGSFTTAILVKAQDLGNGQDLATGTITGNGMIGYTSLTIPPYQAASSYPSRVIGFFFWGSTGQWELFHFDTQTPNGDGDTKPPVLNFSLSVSPTGTIPAAGTTVNVTLTGDFTTSETDYMYVRAYSPTTGQQISSSLGSFRGTSQKLTSLSIKANTLTNDLSVYYQYSLDNGITWITFHNTTQSGVTSPPVLNFSLSVSPTGIIPAAGTTANVTLTGNFTTNETDYMYVRAYSPTTGQQISSSLGYFRGTGHKLTSLYINANTLANELSVSYQYSLDSGKTWITFYSTTQASNKPEPPKELPHVETADGGLVALYDAVSDAGSTLMTWTQAVGIDDSYLYKGHDNPNNRNRQSGCHTYSERADKRDKGLWRVPSGETALYIQQAYLAGKFAQKGVSISTGSYWSSKNTATTGYTYRVTKNGLDSGTSKTSRLAVRCVILKSTFVNL